MTAYVTGKTSLVTGGNSGLGVETVKALATAGSRVVLTSRSVEAGNKVAEQLRAEGVKASAPAHVRTSQAFILYRACEIHGTMTFDTAY